jgi:hypothetical protein
MQSHSIHFANQVLLNWLDNKLKSLAGMKSHPALKIFEARGCELTSTAGLPEMPNLTKLYLVCVAFYFF